MNLKIIERMKHSPLRNYAVPGLTSWLIGNTSEKGCVRLFECEREHFEPIIPHSHRFDFTAVVLEGSVINRVWEETLDGLGDKYQLSTLVYGGHPGEYQIEAGDKVSMRYTETRYGYQSEYSMGANEIHSIYFSRGAKVLFLEGPQVTDQSVILEPVVGGVVVPTFKVEPWMFQKEEQA